MSIDNISSFSSANLGVSNYESAKSTAQTEKFSDMLDDAMTEKDNKKTMEACKEFESYFVQQMYKSMQSTVDDSNSLIKKSQATNIFTDFLVEENAKNIADGGGIGIAKMMYDTMLREQSGIDPDTL